MPPMNPVISSKNYKVMVLTFNRNITLETYTTLSNPKRWRRICLLCRNIHKGDLHPFISIDHNQKEKKLNLHASWQWTVTDTSCAQNKADDSFQCSCSKSLSV